jgi:hypothetical protein
MLLNPMLQLLHLELPVELDEALTDWDLHPEFARMSMLQQSCYAEWVGDSPSSTRRRERAHVICWFLERHPARRKRIHA